ncbi:MAG: carbonic anhydrase [Gemmataceae bacterium]
MRRSYPLLALAPLLLFIPAWRADEPKTPAISPNAALERLKAGAVRFASDKALRKAADTKFRLELSKGQHPFAVILTCADSRVAPEIVFDQNLGDLFVIRVAGNVTGTDAIGSIEYAVAHLHAPLVVVLGHEKCGAVQAALAHADFEGALGLLVRQVHVGRDLPSDEAAALTQAIKNNAAFHAQELVKRSSLMKDFAATGRIRIVPAVYSLKKGAVEWFKDVKVGK